MTKPFVSVIMPAFNAGNYIADSIESVIKQTYPNFELIIIDDGSTDDTDIIIKSAQAKDARIKSLFKMNRNPAATRNEGLKIAQGQWIAFLDSDDLWEADKLEKQIIVLDLNPTVDVVFTSGWIFYGSDICDLRNYSTPTGQYTGNKMYNLLYEMNYIPILSVLMNRNLISKVGFQDETKILASCEDWDYWLRIAMSGAIFYGMPDKLFKYRKHSQGISSNSVKLRTAQSSVLIKNFTSALENPQIVSNSIYKSTYPLIIELIKNNFLDQAIYLYNSLQAIYFISQFKLKIYLLSKFGHYSHIPIRILTKYFK